LAAGYRPNLPNERLAAMPEAERDALLRTMGAAIAAYVAAVYDRELRYGESWDFVYRHTIGQTTADSISVGVQSHHSIDPQAAIAAAGRAAVLAREPRARIRLSAG
jgi:hypothetical protein